MDGLIVIADDMNINLNDQNCNVSQTYRDILQSYDHVQHVNKPTRNDNLIDHIITRSVTIVTIADVLPCSEISDHDAPYVFFNATTEKYQPRYKFIRNYSKFVSKNIYKILMHYHLTYCTRLMM